MNTSYMCVLYAEYVSTHRFLYKVSRLSSLRKALLMDRCGALLLVTQPLKSAGTSVRCPTRGEQRYNALLSSKERLLYLIAYVRIRRNMTHMIC